MIADDDLGTYLASEHLLQLSLLDIYIKCQQYLV